SGLGDIDILEAAAAFRNRLFSCVQAVYESAAELRDFGESVRLASLINHGKSCSFLDADLVRFEVPSRIRSAVRRLLEQLFQRSRSSQCHVLTEVRPERVIETFRLAFIERYNLRDRWYVVLSKRLRRAAKCQKNCQ